MSGELLSALALRKSFGGIVAADNVSISVGLREILCIIGPNGAGKSTLLNLLCGATEPDTGRIVFDGADLQGAPLYEFARRGVVRKFQAPTIFPDLSVSSNIQVAFDATGEPASQFALSEVLDRVTLADQQDITAGLLAHGKKQWLEIGLCLACRPKLLLLDEPTAGMTPEETSQTAKLLKAISSETAVIVIEHDMAFVRDLNCRTCVMHQGRVVRDGRFFDIENDPFVAEIYLGTA